MSSEESVGAKMVSGKLTLETMECREAFARSLNPRFERTMDSGGDDDDGDREGNSGLVVVVCVMKVKMEKRKMKILAVNAIDEFLRLFEKSFFGKLSRE